MAERCKARGVPIRWLSLQETADALRNRDHPGGVIMHRDYTLATRLMGKQDGDHTDLGDNLPKDVIIAKAQQLAGQPVQAGAPPWPLPRDHWFGLITGPAKSHGGYYEWERPYVRLIQQAVVRKGHVPGVTDPASGWVDGLFEQPTADAVASWQRAEMPGTEFFGQVWSDDWPKLLS